MNALWIDEKTPCQIKTPQIHARVWRDGQHTGGFDSIKTNARPRYGQFYMIPTSN